jgi:hypothetical protein
LQCNIHQTYMCEMKLNKKSERKQTHNTVLTESGVFGLLCINIQKGESLLQMTKIGPALFLSSKCIFIQISICWNLNRSRGFRLQQRSLIISILYLCPHLVPETCLFACSVQMTHFSTSCDINLEGSA